MVSSTRPKVSKDAQSASSRGSRRRRRRWPGARRAPAAPATSPPAPVPARTASGSRGCRCRDRCRSAVALHRHLTAAGGKRRRRATPATTSTVRGTNGRSRPNSARSPSCDAHRPQRHHRQDEAIQPHEVAAHLDDVRREATDHQRGQGEQIVRRRPRVAAPGPASRPAPAAPGTPPRSPRRSGAGNRAPCARCPGRPPTSRRRCWGRASRSRPAPDEVGDEHGRGRRPAEASSCRCGRQRRSSVQVAQQPEQRAARPNRKHPLGPGHGRQGEEQPAGEAPAAVAPRPAGARSPAAPGR